VYVSDYVYVAVDLYKKNAGGMCSTWLYPTKYEGRIAQISKSNGSIVDDTLHSSGNYDSRTYPAVSGSRRLYLLTYYDSLLFTWMAGTSTRTRSVFLSLGDNTYSDTATENGSADYMFSRYVSSIRTSSGYSIMSYDSGDNTQEASVDIASPRYLMGFAVNKNKNYIVYNSSGTDSTGRQLTVRDGDLTASTEVSVSRNVGTSGVLASAGNWAFSAMQDAANTVYLEYYDLAKPTGLVAFSSPASQTFAPVSLDFTWSQNTASDPESNIVKYWTLISSANYSATGVCPASGYSSTELIASSTTALSVSSSTNLNIGYCYKLSVWPENGAGMTDATNTTATSAAIMYDPTAPLGYASTPTVSGVP